MLLNKFESLLNQEGLSGFEGILGYKSRYLGSTVIATALGSKVFRLSDR
jgi:hypothetical protein